MPDAGLVDHRLAGATDKGERVCGVGPLRPHDHQVARLDEWHEKLGGMRMALGLDRVEPGAVRGHVVKIEREIDGVAVVVEKVRILRQPHRAVAYRLYGAQPRLQNPTERGECVGSQ
jgi:hypothetical protein